MLENNKNFYFIKLLFSILDDGRKLRLIRYNKNLQRKIDINLIDYKRYSGKYIIYETNKKGKEYDSYLYKNDVLIYEGEYLNVKRNGKGKEYYDKNKLKFEGEYLYGKKWKGIGYEKSKIFLYELKNGQGFVQEFNEYNSIKFEGEYSNGERNGKGKEYGTYGELLFEGNYLNGEKNGKGKEYYESKMIFEGEFLNGKKWNGIANVNFNNITYELRNGKGYFLEVDKNYTLYIGEYLNGLLNGKGQEYQYTNKLLYEGEYKNGKRNGEGKEYYDNKKLKFEGKYLYGHKFKGKEYYVSGELKFEGEYLFNKKWSGKG